MKLVILSSRFPYPLEKGDKLRLFHQISHLSTFHEIHLISLSNEKVSREDQSKLEEYCASVSILPIKKYRSALRSLRSILDSRPFQVNYFYGRREAKKIAEKLEALNPDIVYCQLVRMAEYCRDVRVPKVLDYMDCFSFNYKNRATHESFLKRGFFKAESRKLAAYEKKVAADFDACTVIARRDRVELNVKKDVRIISNGINTDFYSKKESSEEDILLFVGNMGYHPNVLAAKYLVRDVLPKLERPANVRIAGARPTPDVRSLASAKVEVTGWVDDIRNEYSKANIFVAPIFSGAGQQNKILEAMSMELICITTPIVNAAIGGTDGEHLLIAKNAVEFAQKIDHVSSNIDLYKPIRRKAREFVCDHFSWDKENNKLNDIINKVGKLK